MNNTTNIPMIHKFIKLTPSTKLTQEINKNIIAYIKYDKEYLLLNILQIKYIIMIANIVITNELTTSNSNKNLSSKRFNYNNDSKTLNDCYNKNTNKEK